MKITFLRLGHANNSSSSHSIIFTEKLPTSSGDSEFGWDNFTCSSREDKITYFLTTLWGGWRDSCGVTYGYGQDFYIDSTKIEDVIRQQFLDWVNLHFPWAYSNEITPWEGCVDHQSRIGLPKNRITEVLDVGFINEFFKELIDNNYSILGGNDNGDCSHSMYGEGKNLDNDSVNLIYHFLSDASNNVQSLKDKLTNEWVLSRNDGPIMKIKLGTN